MKVYVRLNRLFTFAEDLHYYITDETGKHGVDSLVTQSTFDKFIRLPNVEELV